MRAVDRTSLVAGLVTTVAGLILLLDRLDEIDLDLGYGMPLLIAAVGAILLDGRAGRPAQALLTVPRWPG